MFWVASVIVRSLSCRRFKLIHEDGLYVSKFEYKPTFNSEDTINEEKMDGELWKKNECGIYEVDLFFNNNKNVLMDKWLFFFFYLKYVLI